MKKQILSFAIIFLLFFTISYTHSMFENSVGGNITANIKEWLFNVNVNNAVIENDSYKLHLTGTSGSFTINLSTVNGSKDASYSIELIGDSSIKFYKDSNYNNLIKNNIYKGNMSNNLNKSIIIYYRSDSNINSDIYIKTKGSIMETAVMKNGRYDDQTGIDGYKYFWSGNYTRYIRTVNFDNDLSNLPSSCTEENLCWDISYSQTQKNKVYGYLVDTGLKDSNDNTKPLYNLYIVSDGVIVAPPDCRNIFEWFKNMVQINFNNNFITTNTKNMSNMFYYCTSLSNLNLSSFDTSNVTNMSYMFRFCSSLTNLDLSSFNTSNVIYMSSVFQRCTSLPGIDLSNFNTANVIYMNYMFEDCSSLTNLDLSNFNISKVEEIISVFSGCTSLKSINLGSFNPVSAKHLDEMFKNCSSLTSLDLNRFTNNNATGMNEMFYGCTSLKSINLNGFKTESAKSLESMFYNCSSLTSLDLSGFNTAKVTDMSNMFYGCSSLKNINLSSFNTAEVNYMTGMFANCSSLTNLNLSNFNMINVTYTNIMFMGCSSLTTTINITNANNRVYSSMFYNAATNSGTRITVNYAASASALVDEMIKTKSYNSNVVKGNQI